MYDVKRRTAKYVSSCQLRDKHSPKIAFVLTSGGMDFYSAMTRIAVLSIRITNSKLEVWVVCDSTTDTAMRKTGDPLTGEVDRWIVCETPDGDPGYRNRFLKTRLRSILEGPFLFLDSDVLVRGDLSSLFELDTDLAAARNHSLSDYSEQVWKTDAASLDALGWKVRSDIYANGGVLLYQDTEGAYRFADEWHRRWLHCFDVRNNYRDQPALNAALHASQVRLHQLPDRFNAQFKRNINSLRGAVLWHYYASALGNRPDTLFEALACNLMRGKPLKRSDVERMIDAPHPWRLQSALGYWVFVRGLARGRFKKWESALIHRDILRYLYRIFIGYIVYAFRMLKNCHTTGNA